VLTIKAFAVDATAVRRAATENNFIAMLYDVGFDEWEGEQTLSGLAVTQYLFISTPSLNS